MPCPQWKVGLVPARPEVSQELEATCHSTGDQKAASNISAVRQRGSYVLLLKVRERRQRFLGIGQAADIPRTRTARNGARPSTSSWLAVVARTLRSASFARRGGMSHIQGRASVRPTRVYGRPYRDSNMQFTKSENTTERPARGASARDHRLRCDGSGEASLNR